MTVNSSVNRAEHNGDGTTRSFAFSPYFLEEEDLKVYLRDQGGAETLQTITTHYTISGAANPAGGTVTFETAPDASSKVVIIRDPDLEQVVDYQANDAFPAETHERALDKLTMIVQRLSERLARTIGLAETDTVTSLTLPSNRQDSLLGFNAGGDMEALSKSVLAGATLPNAPVHHSVPRFDGTDGTAMQSSGVTIDDGDNIDAPGTGHMKVPGGTTAQRSTGAARMFRWNSTLSLFEGWISSAWQQFALSSTGNEFNGGQRLKTQSVAYSASPEYDLSAGQRIEVANLTGAIAIGLLQNCNVGEPFEIVLTQDSTGSRAITMNSGFRNQPSSFVTAAGKRMIIWGEVLAVDGNGDMTEAVVTSSWIEP